MTGRTLVLRSLRFHWRSHLGVLLGAMLATAILVGALAVGDSVRYSLRAMALARIQKIELALKGGDRFFRTALANDVAADLSVPVVPAILLRGTVANDSGDARAGQVQVIAGHGLAEVGLGESLSRDAVLLNERLAAKLGAKPGDEVLIRVDKPSLLSRDAPLSTVDDSTAAFRLRVEAIVPDTSFGRFSLDSNQVPPYNVFVPLAELQEKIAMVGRANTLLVGRGSGPPPSITEANSALWRRWKLEDGSLELRTLPGGAQELRTDRVFLDPSITAVATRVSSNARGVMTYFVNELRSGSRATPYSMVAGLEGAPLPPGMRDDEAVINSWMAEDLGVKAGDSLELSYFVLGPMRKLVLQTSRLRIREVVPLSGAAADPELMPEFPGVSHEANCRDWRPGIPIDLKKIRPKDEAYWDAHRGTPKAFITLHAAQEMWHNRFGSLTAVRYPAAANGGAGIDARLRQALNPSCIGLFFTPIRQQALAASGQSMDFGALFLGFSFFLIVAALLLAALLFALGVEQRAEEVGLLLALGFPPRRVQRLLLLEGGALALVAGVVGAAAGVLYTQVVIRALATVWRGAVASSPLQYHTEPATLAGGGAAGFLVALLAIWLVTRRQARIPARELLASGAEAPAPRSASRWPRFLGAPAAAVAFIGALVLIGAAAAGKREQAAETFFTAGALLLISGILACRAVLAWLEVRSTGAALSVGSLGMRNSARRWGRSLAAVSLLACGSFLVIAIGASRHDPAEGAWRRSSGTGGFALYGESTLPVFQDLNSDGGLDAYGLTRTDVPETAVVPLRLRQGDEASCLNLNRAQTPRVLGVDPAALGSRRAFTFVNTAVKLKDPWALLDQPVRDAKDSEAWIPAIGDENTLMWALEKGVGDTVSYVDDRGQPFRLKIVGMLANSVLQGSLLISEQNFIQRFPNESGYQVFLVDAPPAGAAQVQQALSRGLEDAGLDLTPAASRLADFSTVENTYLSIFAVLGGLGLMLGSIGLGVVVLRNVLERRGELALLRAVGFRKGTLQWLVFSEHSLLLGLGLLVGVAAALVAVLPALGSPGAGVPYATLGAELLLVLVSGFLWTWGATAFSLQGRLIASLRSE